MERKLVATGTAALALAMVGCGSSGPMTRPDFTKQANAICTHRRALTTAATTRHQGNRTAIVSAVYPAFQDAIKKLEALRPPAEWKSDYDSVMAFERLQVRAMAYFRKTGRVLPGSTEDGPPLHRHEAMRARMGMRACDL
ncbi:MAG TPA: hypothetical protein VN635_13205 [Conexibacter sp.]|nr:hypothetical protein [Conexibacter sp.]